MNGRIEREAVYHRRWSDPKPGVWRGFDVLKFLHDAACVTAALALCWGIVILVWGAF